MTRIPPLDVDHLSGDRRIQEVARRFGFVPSSLRTLAYSPELLDAALALGDTVERGEVDVGLKRLVAFMRSLAAGCRYCSVHTAGHASERLGVSQTKVDAVLDYEDSPLFDDGERAALRVAWAAGRVPNEVTDEMIAELRRHWSDAQCVEIVGAISVYAFFNSWNDTLRTQLEPDGERYEREHLADRSE